MPSKQIEQDVEFDPILQGGGECGALIRSLDWRSNPLGCPRTWPQELRAVLGIILGSSQPMFVVWGPEQITLYNDSYATICGNRHPAAMGKTFRGIWFDIWDQLDPIVADAYDGISTSMDDIELIMHRHGYAEETHFAFSYSPVRDSTGTVLGMFCACAETTGQVIMQRRLAKEREQMRQIFEMALGSVAILNGPDHVFTFANSDYEVLAGRKDLVGKRVADALPEVVAQGFVALLDGVLQTGQPYVGRSMEIDLVRSPGSPAERRLIDFAYHPIAGHDGRAEGIFVQAIDVTEQANAERRQQLLNHELAHRMKNQLALVQAVANLTLRSAPDLATARASLGQRLGVLGRAQDMLLSGTAEAQTITSIVNEMAMLHAHPVGERIRFSGPDLAIGGRAALSLSLMLHELSTNATKYGALSVDTGSVSITWRTEQTPDGECFRLDWEETGGPPVSEPSHSGLGTSLLNAGVSGARISRVNLSYPPAGVRCDITVDVEGLLS